MVPRCADERIDSVQSEYKHRFNVHVEASSFIIRVIRKLISGQVENKITIKITVTSN